MNLVGLVADALKARSSTAVLAWVALCVVTALVFRVAGDEPLDATQLSGMGAVWAVVVLAVVAVASWMGKRRAARPRPDQGKATGGIGDGHE